MSLASASRVFPRHNGTGGRRSTSSIFEGSWQHATTGTSDGFSARTFETNGHLPDDFRSGLFSMVEDQLAV